MSIAVDVVVKGATVKREFTGQQTLMGNRKQRKKKRISGKRKEGRPFVPPCCLLCSRYLSLNIVPCWDLVNANSAKTKVEQ